MVIHDRHSIVLEMDNLGDEADAWANGHGLQMMTGTDEMCTHAPITVLPSPFDKNAFNLAKELALPFNRLVDSVARNTPWLYSTLENVTDDFTQRLMHISKSMEEEGISQKYYLGINRSDYMSHEGKALLQIELNTIASSFGCLSARVSEMHRFLLGRYSNNPALSSMYESEHLEGLRDSISERLPENCADKGISLALATAAKLQNAGKQSDATIAFVVQPGEKNSFDQRMLEYDLWTSHGVGVVRITMNDVALYGAIADGCLLVHGIHISVVYFRAGYTPSDYPTEIEWQGRSIIERSNAIKCPSIAYHLVGTKKVQQKLAVAGELEKFVTPGDSTMLRRSFAGLWSLDPTDIESSQDAIQLAIGDPSKYVVKPQREGGGNNFYGDQVKKALTTMKKEELAAYILMARIFPLEISSPLLRKGKVQLCKCVQELGVYGCFLGNGDDVVFNTQVGHLLRTKAVGVDEGGVATGFSCLDSPLLI